MAQRPRGPAPQPAFQEFQASVLFCQRCGAPRPVRERMLLYLPDGELREYRCSVCGASVGSRKVVAAPPGVITS
jgi:hypothetical protein